MKILPLLGLLLFVTPRLVRAQTFQNPLAGRTEFHIIGSIILWLISLASAVALIALVVGGLMLILSIGNEQKMSRAKQIIFWAIAGIAVVMLAWVILATVGQVIGIGTFFP